MTFPFNVYLAAFASAFLTTLLSLPLWRKWCLRAGLVDEPGQRKIHHQPVPLAGGLAVMSGLLVPVLLGAALLFGAGLNHGLHSPPSAFGPSQPGGARMALDANDAYLLQYGLSHRALQLAAIFAGAIGILLVGWVDDKHELRARMKFAGQVLVALVVAASGVRITLFVHNVLFHYAVTILWIVAVINACNFTDNMNGLCAGLAAIAAGYFGLLAAAQGQYLVALIAFLTCGALLGFLPYNFPQARAFLGDAGSHLLGYLLAVLAILPHFYGPLHPRRWAVLIPLLVLAVPLLDLLWVVLLRWRLGRPVYQADTNHLSHRLVRLGLAPTLAVPVLWLAATVLGALAFLLAG